jgi:hypothetical protein
VRRAAVVASVAVVALVAGACSGSSKSGGTAGGPPQAVVAHALAAFTGGKSGKVTVTTFGSAADVNALSAKPDKNLATIAKLFGTTSAVVSFERGSTALNGKSAVDVTLAGEDKAVDLVYLDQVAYLRADLKQFDSSTGSKLGSEVSSLATELPFLGTIAAGNYVSLDFGTGAGKSLAPVIVGGLGKIPSEVNSALVTGTTVTRAGSDSVGDRYAIVGQSRQLAQTLQTDISALPPPIPSLLGNVIGDVTKIEQQPITIDAWVSGGVIKQIVLDLRQFRSGPGPANPVGLKVEFATSSGGITAPAKATPVDLAKLAPLLSLLGGSTTSTTVK